MAMRASAACRLPTCLCSSPARERMNTSNSGQSLLIACSLKECCTPLGGGTCRLLARMRGGGLAHPLPALVGRPPCLQALAVARAVALEHRVEFAPVDRADI